VHASVLKTGKGGAAEWWSQVARGASAKGGQWASLCPGGLGKFGSEDRE